LIYRSTMGENFRNRNLNFKLREAENSPLSWRWPKYPGWECQSYCRFFRWREFLHNFLNWKWVFSQEFSVLLGSQRCRDNTRAYLLQQFQRIAITPAAGRAKLRIHNFAVLLMFCKQRFRFIVREVKWGKFAEFIQ
jgi:hypothetical protein